MKSEERRHLAENDLEQTLHRWLDKIEPYSNYLLGGLLVATAVAVGGILWWRSAETSETAGWADLATAKSPDEFLAIGKEYSGTRAGQWAKIRGARMYYDRGVAQSLTNRPASDDDLEEAKTLFGELVQVSLPDELREAALDGYARTLEATSGGDTSKAVEAYETLVRNYPDSVFGGYAKHRIEALKTAEVQEFYAWFSKQNPMPPERPQPKDGETTNGAAGSLSTPDLPEFNLNPGETTAPSTPPASNDSIDPVLPPVGQPETPPTTPPATEGASESAPAETTSEGQTPPPAGDTPPAAETQPPAAETTESPAPPPAAETPPAETESTAPAPSN